MSLSSLFLILHVFGGLVGVAASAATAIFLAKGKAGVVRATASALLSVAAYISAWVLGGWYYLQTYGSAVKPVIKAGRYILAHTIVMETKEHLFLFLPFLALTLFLTVRSVRRGAHELLVPAKTLALLCTVFGLLMLFAGLAISAAYELSR